MIDHELFPQPAVEDKDIMRRESVRVVRGSDELPDIDITYFESLEEYAKWLLEGERRFCS